MSIRDFLGEKKIQWKRELGIQSHNVGNFHPHAWVCGPIDFNHLSNNLLLDSAWQTSGLTCLLDAQSSMNITASSLQTLSSISWWISNSITPLNHLLQLCPAWRWFDALSTYICYCQSILPPVKMFDWINLSNGIFTLYLPWLCSPYYLSFLWYNSK